ncbi:MAG: nicotinate-nucleotide--dimethylbenzimidazole phosphoribosyltransferase [Myxococcales bacterium]|nr:nicotinate-nucleotide--dimethylbenzimidazole phosphoribosyltransferase [Myxococcales bacterium]
MILPPVRTWGTEAEANARAHLLRLGAPSGGLGRLETLAAWWCGATDSFPPRAPAPARLCVFVGDHGIASRGVSALPIDATPALVARLLTGGATVNAFARHVDVALALFDVGCRSPLRVEPSVHATVCDRRVRAGTDDMTESPAMSRAEAEAAVRVGIEVASEAATAGVALLGAGDLGVGGTTAAAACLAAVAGMPGKLVAGRGSGLDDDGLARKVAVIDRAIGRHRPDRDDAIGILASVGGLELGAIAGLCIGGASLGLPVMLDGLVSTAGGMLANVLQPGVSAWFQVGHKSAEKAHWGLCRMLGKDAIHELDLHVGGGAGAALGIDSVRLAWRLLGRGGG